MSTDVRGERFASNVAGLLPGLLPTTPAPRDPRAAAAWFAEHLYASGQVFDVRQSAELVSAVRAEDASRTAELLRRGADANSRVHLPDLADALRTERSVFPVLWLAAFRGHAGVIHALLAAGADPDAECEGWEAASLVLAGAAHSPHDPCIAIERLFAPPGRPTIAEARARAEPSAMRGNPVVRKPSLALLFRGEVAEPARCLLHAGMAASERERWRDLLQLLLASDADADGRPASALSSISLLAAADLGGELVRAGLFSDFCGRLAENGGALEAKSDFLAGLYLAVLQPGLSDAEQREGFLTLRELGLPLNAPVGQTTAWLPLLLAARHDSVLVRHLLAEKANPYQRNGRGETAMDIARRHGSKKAIQYLVRSVKAR